MLARTNKIIHPLGIIIETPLLVPSFSSKGFAFYNNNKKEKGANDISEAFGDLKITKDKLIESMLVSAYDIHYGHLPLTEELICTEITIIDSGGYETGEFYDLPTVTKYKYAKEKWDESKQIGVITGWPAHKAAVIVSFDDGEHRIPIKQQVLNARKLFAQTPHMLNDFLIKPEKKRQNYVKINNVITHIKELGSFSIIGITEKELGNSILLRMKNLYKIRTELDKYGISAPIHVFGSLDPITSILYFLVGAEIFDGLTWLKYSYFNGSAIYIANCSVLDDEMGIELHQDKVRWMSLTRNTYYLKKMKRTMKNFVKNKDFNVFNELGSGFGQLIEKNYQLFKSKNQ